MKLKEKLLETSATLRTRAQRLSASAVQTARDPAQLLSVLDGARREFGKVARRHASRLVQQNASIASDLRKDVATLARSTYAAFSARPAAKKSRRAPVARKRAARAA